MHTEKFCLWFLTWLPQESERSEKHCQCGVCAAHLQQSASKVLCPSSFSWIKTRQNRGTSNWKTKGVTLGAIIRVRCAEPLSSPWWAQVTVLLHVPEHGLLRYPCRPPLTQACQLARVMLKLLLKLLLFSPVCYENPRHGIEAVFWSLLCADRECHGILAEGFVGLCVYKKHSASCYRLA